MNSALPAGPPRVSRRLVHSFGFTVAMALGFTAIVVLAGARWASYEPVLEDYLARDFLLYRDVTARWLSGGPFYEPYQLAGPYEVTAGDILYPPTALLLFLPFVALPALLWWVIPIGVVGWALWKLRPAPIVWPVIALCIWFPNTGIKVLTGNPVMWSVAAMALGTIYYWPAVLATLKLSLAPLSLFGAWKRSWWYAAAALGAVSLLFLPMWPDFLIALRNSRQPAGLLYSVGEVPMMLIPVIAWLGRRPDRR
jgi:hypothetical protein